MPGEIIRSEPKRYAGVLLVDGTGCFLLQLRDDIPGIAYPGWVTVFGGSLEGSESFLECAVRELAEETGIAAAAHDLEPLAQMNLNDENGAPREIAVFLKTDVRRDRLVVTEGRLLTVRPDELDDLWPRLTPEAAQAVEIAIALLRDR